MPCLHPGDGDPRQCCGDNGAGRMGLGGWVLGFFSGIAQNTGMYILRKFALCGADGAKSRGHPPPLNACALARNDNRQPVEPCEKKALSGRRDAGPVPYSLAFFRIGVRVTAVTGRMDFSREYGM
jgi:hypothetical protein